MVRKAIRRHATPEQAERVRKAIAEEEQYKEATLAQIREMRDAYVLSRDVLATLREAREKQGLSLADMMARTGMTREAISRLENSKEPNPTLRTLTRYASALGLKLTIDLNAAP